VNIKAGFNKYRNENRLCTNINKQKSTRGTDNRNKLLPSPDAETAIIALRKNGKLSTSTKYEQQNNNSKFAVIRFDFFGNRAIMLIRTFLKMSALW
jgi:hypothetical protein